MPLKGIPDSISPELLYALARMGHGDSLVIADANYPSDQIAKTSTIGSPIRVNCSVATVLKDILQLFPLDQYMSNPVQVMDRVQSDKDKDLKVPAYSQIAEVANCSLEKLEYVERFAFYEKTKSSFLIVQTTDRQLYANVIIYKGVL